MRKNEHIQTLGMTADLLNTISGGISDPNVTVTKGPDAHHLTVKVPGVDPLSLEIQVAFNRLHIHHTFTVESAGKRVGVPRIIFSKAIPYYINADKIEATTGNASLLVTLPFNEKANGDARRISIKDNKD